MTKCCDGVTSADEESALCTQTLVVGNLPETVFEDVRVAEQVRP